MNAAKNKLKSQRGASITFALLLFLVCAVISSVVIVAATAAAGRMSEQADMDERYYAVTAVARKLITEIDGKKLTLEYTKADKPENIDTSNITVTTPSSGLDGTEIVVHASKWVLTKTAQPIISVDGDAAIKNSDESISCTITGRLEADGTLNFDIIAVTVKDSRAYNLKLSFFSTLKQYASDASSTTATADVEWKLLGAEKVRSDRT